MARRPLTSAQLSAMRDPYLARQVALVEMEARFPDGSFARSSKRDLFSDPPSTGAPKKSTRQKKPNFKKALADAKGYGEQIIKGQWEPRHAADLVGLYAALHEHLYGVEALELREEYGAAVSACRKLLKDEFGSEEGRGPGPLLAAAEGCMEYVRWACARARKIDKRKRSEGDEDTFRLGWRLVFKSRKWLVDWRAARR